jgi:hypothetical protein
MTTNNAVVAIFANHQAAEVAIRKLAASGLDLKHFSIVGKGYHTEETPMGFYNVGDRVKFWGQNGAMWGGLWGLFFGGMLMVVPVVGPVMVLGPLAATVFSALEGAIVVGGLSALGAAIYGLGIPKDSVIRYEEALKADGFLIVAHGPVDETKRARTMLEAMSPRSVDFHEDVKDMVETPATYAGRAM